MPRANLITDERQAARTSRNAAHAEGLGDSRPEAEGSHGRLFRGQVVTAATVHEPSWGETILRLRAGEHAPVGLEIKRIIGCTQQLTGAGANYEEVYVVACQKVKR